MVEIFLACKNMWIAEKIFATCRIADLPFDQLAKGKAFFSEEKNQKTFTLDAIPDLSGRRLFH